MLPSCRLFTGWLFAGKKQCSTIIYIYLYYIHIECIFAWNVDGQVGASILVHRRFDCRKVGQILLEFIKAHLAILVQIDGLVRAQHAGKLKGMSRKQS